MCSNNQFKASLILKIVSASKSDQFAQESNQDLNILQVRRSHDLSGDFLQCLPTLMLIFSPLNIKSEFSFLALGSVAACPFFLHHQEGDSYSQRMMFSSKLNMY